MRRAWGLLSVAILPVVCAMARGTADVVAATNDDAQVALGKQLFERRCSGCHAMDRDKEGPRLGGVYGRKAGVVASFGYSKAMMSANVTWNDATLEMWLRNPNLVVPGNDMDFRVANADERKALVAYLKAYQSSGAGR